MKTQFVFLETDFDAGECRRDQRRLQALTLPVTYTRVRDKVIGVWERVWGGRGVGRNIPFGVEIWVENSLLRRGRVLACPAPVADTYLASPPY